MSNTASLKKEYAERIARGMMEYERALIDDIMYYSKIKGSKKFSDAWYEKVERSSFVYGNRPGEDKIKAVEWDKKQAKYLNWLSKLTKKGTPISIPNDDFKEWISLFSENSRTYSPDNGYNYNIDYTPKPLAKVLELASSCY